MKSFIQVIFLLSLFTALTTCSDQGTNPPTEQPKDPREMTWTVDTIYYPGAFQTLMSNFYAFSSKNIYVVGHSSQGFAGSLYHFNGNKWENVNYNARGILLRITGIENELWGVGYRGTEVYGVRTEYSHIVKYDGQTWQEIILDNLWGLVTLGSLQAISAENKNNIWAGGADGIVVHYNGSKWVKDSVRIPHPSRFSYGIKSIVMYQNKPFIMGTMFGGTSGEIKVYHITGSEKNWILKDSMIIKPGVNNIWKFGQEDLHVGKSGKLYSIGGDVWEYQNGQWTKIYTSQQYISGMYELREDYIFVVGHYSHLAFYDGKSWSRLTQLEAKIPGVIYYDVWTDGKEVFIVGNLTDGVPMKSIVWHGK